MNQQQVFDKVSAHLLKQNSKAINDDGDCQYRCEDGRSCAIGCLLSDSQYSNSFEGETVNSNPKIIKSLSESLGEEITEEDIVLLRGLQNIHDDFREDEWEDELINLGKYHGLSVEDIPL